MLALAVRKGHLMTQAQVERMDSVARPGIEGLAVASLRGGLVPVEALAELLKISADVGIPGWGKLEALQVMETSMPLSMVGPVAASWGRSVGPHTSTARRLAGSYAVEIFSPFMVSPQWTNRSQELEWSRSLGALALEFSRPLVERLDEDIQADKENIPPTEIITV